MKAKKKLPVNKACISLGCSRPAVVRGFCRQCESADRERKRRGYVYYGFKGK